MWNSRRILREIAGSQRRQRILRAFWRHADATTRALATAQLARAVHFREETIRKMPPEKKSELLASRLGSFEFEQIFEAALMQCHTHEANEMMAAFLDRWAVPHVNGSIESDDYTPPSSAAVRDAVKEFEGRFDRRDVAIYLATAGLFMGEAWSEATWPVVEELTRSA